MRERSLEDHAAGEILLEILIGLAIFAVGIALVGILVLDALPSHRLGEERVRALALAEEGLEATRSIRDDDYKNLKAGTHGLALSGGEWVLFGSSDTTGPFSRSITITLLSGNRADITSNISWQFSPGRSEIVTLVTRLTKWK